MSTLSSHSIRALLALCALTSSPSISHAQLGKVITAGPGGTIYDIGPTGALSNPCDVAQQVGGAIGFVGIARVTSSIAYGVTRSFSGTAYPDHVFSLGLSACTAGTLGTQGITGSFLDEGDCAIDPTTSTLYAMNASGTLYSFVTTGGNPTGTALWTASGLSDPSGMAFDPAGNLYVLTLGSGGAIKKLDKSNGTVLQTWSLASAQLKTGFAALCFNPGSTHLLLVIAMREDGTLIGRQSLFKFDLNGGQPVRLGDVTYQNGFTTLITGMIAVNGYTGNSFCTGDGLDLMVVAACPCVNFGEAGHGCASSSTLGAVLMAQGSTLPDPITGTDTLVLTAGDALPNALTIFLQGNAIVSGGAVFGDGIRCAGGSLKRIGVEHASGGVAQYPNAGEPSISQKSAMLGDPIPTPSTRYYQAYYRDPSGMFCPAGATFNVSNGVEVEW